MSDYFICSTCGRTLDVIMNAHGVTYAHTASDVAGTHEVAPVPAPEGWTGGRCDFCNGEPPTHVLPASDFVTPGADEMTSGGDWAMCADCAQLSQRNQWRALTRRSVDTYVQRNGPLTSNEVGEVAAAVARLHRRLRKAVTGPLREI